MDEKKCALAARIFLDEATRQGARMRQASHICAGHRVFGGIAARIIRHAKFRRGNLQIKTGRRRAEA